MKVCLFFSHGVSLKKWAEIGSISREVHYYKLMVERGVDVGFVTYGDQSDEAYLPGLGGIALYPLFKKGRRPHSHLGVAFASILAAWRIRGELNRYDVLKSNQMLGSWIPFALSFFMKKKFLLRCGFEQQATFERENKNVALLFTFYLYSKMIYSASERVIVTTVAIKREIAKKFGIAIDKIEVIPNFIDTNIFAAFGECPKAGGVIYVGRLSREKNLDLLIKACKKANVPLTLVGKGPLENRLKMLSDEIGSDTRFSGSIPNSELPKLLSQHRIFALLSKYEGNPKALMEAMACAMPVIGADVDGINNLLEHRRTGMLCKPDVDEISSTLENLLNDGSAAEEMGLRAREFIIRNFSITRILELERSALDVLCNA